MTEKNRLIAENTSAYADRVKKQFNRISKLLGKETALFFNEYIRGASFLDGNNLVFLSQMESVSDDELILVIESIEATSHEFMALFNATSVYNTFERILEIGRTKIFKWRNGSYLQIQISEIYQSCLPWAGAIYVGGPNPSITGNVAIAKNYNIVFGSDFVEINGHKF